MNNIHKFFTISGIIRVRQTENGPFSTITQ